MSIKRDATKTTRTDAARSTAWSIASQGTQVILGVASVALLSRWLSPADYGEIAMAGSVTALVGYIADSGVTAALTRQPHVSRESEAAAFWIALIGGLILGAACALAAPLLGLYYGSARIAWLAAAMSMAFATAAPSRVPVAQLTRNLRFRTLAGLTATSTAIGIAAGVAAAMHGMGPWSLVLQQLATFATQSVVGQLLYPAPMSLSQARNGNAKEIAREGSHIGGFALCLSASRALDPVVAGPAFGAEPLGALGMADRLLHVPVARMAAAINNVFLPVVTHLKHSDERARAFEGAVRMALLVITPVAFGIPAIGKPLISLFPERWWTVIQFLPFVGAIALTEPIIQLSSAIMTASGRTSALLRAGLGLVPLGWALAAVGGRGPDMRWMLGCVLGWYVVEAVLLFWLAGKCLNRRFDLHALLARPVLCGAVMFVAVRAVVSFSGGPYSGIGVPVGILAGGLCYLPAAFLLQNGAWNEVRSMLAALASKRRSAAPQHQP